MRRRRTFGIRWLATWLALGAPGAALAGGCGDDDAAADAADVADSPDIPETGADGDADAGADGDADADIGGDASCSFTMGQDPIPQPAGPVPEPGVPFVVPQTGVVVTRISDVGDPGVTETDLTNGYSRWSPANRGGEYVIAFGTGGTSYVYRLADRTIVRALAVGEPNELHWDQSGAEGTATTLYYRTGTELRRTDVRTGTDALVHDFAVEYPAAGAAMNAVEGAPSRDMRYWAFLICGDTTGGGTCETLLDIVVYDREADAIAGRLSDHATVSAVPNYVDISPSGSRAVLATCAGESGDFDGPHAWSLDFAHAWKVGNDCTHAGWAWGYDGQEYFVSQDNCAGGDPATCDHIIAVDVNDPDGWASRLAVLYHGDLGWGAGFHFGRVYDPAVRGWFFLSIIDETDETWASNQLVFVELVPLAAGPRIWRVAPTMNEYSDYWSEAFASLDAESQNVYWGANWNGADNLELYRAQLCPRWWETLAP